MLKKVFCSGCLVFFTFANLIKQLRLSTIGCQIQGALEYGFMLLTLFFDPKVGTVYRKWEICTKL